MNNINTSDLLVQLRAMAQQAGLKNSPSTTGTQNSEFSALLKQSIDNVSKRQQVSAHLRNSYELGDSRVPLSQVMIEGQKSRIAFETLTQVRNKLLTAYREIMRMPI